MVSLHIKQNSRIMKGMKDKTGIGSEENVLHQRDEGQKKHWNRGKCPSSKG